MLSVIIPSRSSEYLQQTIDDLLSKAEGDIEIIVCLDGYWPDPMPRDDKRVRYIHRGTKHNNKGMRDAINAGMAMAKGKYVMKCDEHTMWDKGFDTKLAADCEDNWVVVPRRYRLDPDEWRILEDGRRPVDYMKIDYPYERIGDRTCGLHGSEDKERFDARKDFQIDDLMTMQGSCYFMHRSFWKKVIREMDTESYGPFTQEAQEIGNKAWLSGGRLVVNKKTWYAHLHKGKRGKNYGFSNAQYDKHQADMERGRLFCIEYWLNTKDYPRDFAWLVDKFAPVKGWGPNWKEDVIKARALENEKQN